MAVTSGALQVLDLVKDALAANASVRTWFGGITESQTKTRLQLRRVFATNEPSFPWILLLVESWSATDYAQNSALANGTIRYVVSDEISEANVDDEDAASEECEERFGELLELLDAPLRNAETEGVRLQLGPPTVAVWPEFFERGDERTTQVEPYKYYQGEITQRYGPEL